MTNIKISKSFTLKQILQSQISPRTVLASQGQSLTKITPLVKTLTSSQLRVISPQSEE
jgi:hypothetical protein